MIPEYQSAHSLDEALDHLRLKGDRTKVLAGGTDVMVELRTARMDGAPCPDFFLDISLIADLRSIELHDDEVRIGAAVTFHDLILHPDLQKKLPLLIQASSRIGSQQVRHLATLGGNVGTASPAGDGITPLVALEAEAIIQSTRGTRRLLVSELITGPGKTTLEADELISGFIVKLPSQPEFLFFEKVMRRQAVAIARMNTAIQLVFNASGKISTAHIAAGAVLPRPRRLREVEELLANESPGEALFLSAGEAAAQVMLTESGNRPSMVYKVPALKGLVTKGLRHACLKRNHHHSREGDVIKASYR